MELFGKTLVLVNLGLSFMMAAVGGAVLYYHADWTDNPATESQPAGMLLPREVEYTKLSGYQLDTSTRKYNTAKRNYALIDGADASWKAARAALPVLEAQRQKEQGWYAEELEHPRTNPKNQAIVEVDETYGRAALDPNTGLPKMKPAVDRFGAALLSMTAFNDALIGKSKEIVTTLADIDKTEKADRQLTERLLGSDTARGLIQRLKDEQDKLRTITNPHPGKDEKLGELELVILAEGQTRADLQLLTIRHGALQARIKELERTAAAAGTNP